MPYPLAQDTRLVEREAPGRAARGAAWLPAAGLALILVAYNNLLFALPWGLGFPPPWVFYPRAILLPLLAVAWAVWAQRLSLSDLGITIRNFAPSLAAGLGLAAVVAVPAVIYFTFPIGIGEGSIDYNRSTFNSAGNFIYWALVRYPLNAAIFEEVLFRGVLFALAVRAFGVRRSILLTAVAFSAWHIVVNHTTMNDTNVANNAVFFALAQAGALVALFVGGLALAFLRHRWGSLAGPIAFHWLAVVAMNAALFAQAD